MHTEIKVGDFVVADTDNPDYYVKKNTPYEVLEVHGGFLLLKDQEATIFARINKCFHLNGGNWVKI